MELRVPIDDSTPAKANAEMTDGAACERSGQGGWGRWAVSVISMLGMTLASAQAAYRARQVPSDLAFVLFAYVALALLFWCLRRYEQLALEPSSDQDGGERWRLKLGVWVLSTALSMAFAWRVAAVMPPAMKAAVWGMTSVVAIAGFYVLFVWKASIGGYSELDTTGQVTTTSLKPDHTI